MKRRLIFTCMLLMLLVGCTRIKVEGEPDCVSSSSYNEELRLTIVANRDVIEDEENFEKEILEMCKNNSFKSTVLSTDIQGFPEKITAEIYLKKEDIFEGASVLCVEIEKIEEVENFDIRIIKCSL